jgi:TfoX/Sxy family transcriptional regulator of competence genes
MVIVAVKSYIPSDIIYMRNVIYIIVIEDNIYVRVVDIVEKTIAEK